MFVREHETSLQSHWRLCKAALMPCSHHMEAVQKDGKDSRVLCVFTGKLKMHSTT